MRLTTAQKNALRKMIVINGPVGGSEIRIYRNSLLALEAAGYVLIRIFDGPAQQLRISITPAGRAAYAMSYQSNK